VSHATLKAVLTNRWVEVFGSVPLLVGLLLLGALQVVEDPRVLVWSTRLWRASWLLSAVFLVLVAARFAVLPS
jgi:hypothetical protein